MLFIFFSQLSICPSVSLFLSQNGREVDGQCFKRFIIQFLNNRTKIFSSKPTIHSKKKIYMCVCCVYSYTLQEHLQIVPFIDMKKQSLSGISSMKMFCKKLDQKIQQMRAFSIENNISEKYYLVLQVNLAKIALFHVSETINNCEIVYLEQYSCFILVQLVSLIFLKIVFIGTLITKNQGKFPSK